MQGNLHTQTCFKNMCFTKSDGFELISISSQGNLTQVKKCKKQGWCDVKPGGLAYMHWRPGKGVSTCRLLSGLYLCSVPERGLRYFFHPHWHGKEAHLFERVPDDSKRMSPSGGHIHEAKACFGAYLQVQTLDDIHNIQRGHMPDPYMFLHYASSKRFTNPNLKQITVVDFPGTPCRCSTCTR